LLLCSKVQNLPHGKQVTGFNLKFLSFLSMAYQKQKQHRLPGYDYTQPGSYFITICTHEREHFFGEVERGQVSLTTIGRTAEYFLQKIPHTFKNSTLDTWVVMPNHVHLILVLWANDSGYSRYAPRRVPTGLSNVYLPNLPNGLCPLTKGSVSSIINHFKGNVKRWCNKNGFEHFQWQSRFHDHIIRTEASLETIRNYIQNNPANWGDDRFSGLK
jgi:REP element-mobilizing transposase RayT